MIGILLAAGFSRRFGALDKLSQRLPDGELMAMTAAKHLIQALPQSIAVVKHDDIELAANFKKIGLQVVYCAPTANSMAESLVTGVRAVSLLPAKGCVIALADMPFIQPTTITQVADALTPNGIVVPIFEQQRGHPVAFAREYYPYLLETTGDNGAKAIVQRFADHIKLLPCDDVGILQDIDTPEMLKTYFVQKT